MAKYSASTIAKYILSLSDADAGDVISNLKLQKLLYYTQGFSFALNGKALFDSELFAWQHGPVVPSVYHDYKVHGSGLIPVPADFDAMDIAPEDRSLIDEVYNVYGQYSAWKLRDMTHSEPPWVDAYRDGAGAGSVIPEDSLKSFFATLVKN